MSEWNRKHELHLFKSEVLKKLVYKNTIKFFLLFLCEGILLYSLVQILDPFTLLYNHVWSIGILTCVVVLLLLYLNVTSINDVMTAQGRLEWDYDFDRYFCAFANIMISFAAIVISYSAVDYLVIAVMTIVLFKEVMNILAVTIFLLCGIISIMVLLLRSQIDFRRSETWWREEMEVLFNDKIANDAVKGLIKASKSVIEGQYDR